MSREKTKKRLVLRRFLGGVAVLLQKSNHKKRDKTNDHPRNHSSDHQERKIISKIKIPKNQNRNGKLCHIVKNTAEKAHTNY